MVFYTGNFTYQTKHECDVCGKCSSCMIVQTAHSNDLLHTSSSYGRLWICLPSFVPAYVLHLFYFIFILILYIYRTVYFSPLWSGRPSPFWKVEFQCSCFLEERDEGHNRPKLVARISKIKKYKQLAVTDFLWKHWRACVLLRNPISLATSVMPSCWWWNILGPRS
jgi:hypothetical protein